MRLWHYKLIPYLPDKQLDGQWNELGSIYKGKKHKLINYVYARPIEELFLYSLFVIYERLKRNKTCRVTKYFINKFQEILLNLDSDMVLNEKEGEQFNLRWIQDSILFWKFVKKVQLFPQHNNRYLFQCFYNLQEKYDRGQKDFRYGLYLDLEDFIKNEIH